MGVKLLSHNGKDTVAEVKFMAKIKIQKPVTKVTVGGNPKRCGRRRECLFTAHRQIWNW